MCDRMQLTIEKLKYTLCFTSKDPKTLNNELSQGMNEVKPTWKIIRGIHGNETSEETRETILAKDHERNFISQLNEPPGFSKQNSSHQNKLELKTYQ